MMDPYFYNISPQEQEYLDRLKKVFVVMSEELEERRVRKKLHEIMGEYEFNFTKYMNDVEALFGRFRKISKEFQKSLQRERLKGYINALRKEQPKGYMSDIARYEDLLMKLDRLNEPETEETFDWDTLALPDINYSSSTAFLNGESEDIEIIEDVEELPLLAENETKDVQEGSENQV